MTVRPSARLSAAAAARFRIQRLRPQEQRLISERPIDPSIRKAIVEDNKVRRAYARVGVPVVALYRTTTREQALEEYRRRTTKSAPHSSRATRGCKGW
jgi:hypothetical protein